MRLINKSMQEKINDDFISIQESLKFSRLNGDLSKSCQTIHKNIVVIKIFLNRFGHSIKPNALKYLNEMVSDLIEAYVLLFQDRYKTSKILLRSSIDCLIRGLYIEKVSIEFENTFTDTLKKLNGALKEIYGAKSISINFLDKAFDDLKEIFDNTSAYVHAGMSAELSQYSDINTIINPNENKDLKNQHSTEMQMYIEQMLFYLLISNYGSFYEKSPANEQNLILEVLNRPHLRIIDGNMKQKYFE